VYEVIISTNQIQPAAKVYSDTKKIFKTAKTDVSAKTPQADEVVLSTNAQDFGSMLRKLQSLSDVRQAKVQDLSERVAQGTYHVDAYAIADKISSNGFFDQQG
jgi:negative regulator of flagellin synthesis FlgM